jgi:hypothetical protein
MQFHPKLDISHKTTHPCPNQLNTPNDSSKFEQLQLTCTFTHLHATTCPLLRAQVAPWCQLTCAKTTNRHPVGTQFHLQIVPQFEHSSSNSSDPTRANAINVQLQALACTQMSTSARSHCNFFQSTCETVNIQRLEITQPPLQIAPKIEHSSSTFEHDLSSNSLQCCFNLA